MRDLIINNYNLICYVYKRRSRIPVYESVCYFDSNVTSVTFMCTVLISS